MINAKKSSQKGNSFRVAMIFGSIGATIWIIFGASQSAYFPPALVTIPIPFLCLFLANHWRRVGALVTIVSGFIPWAVIVIGSLPGSSSNLWGGFLLISLVGTGFMIVTPLVIAGIIIYIAPTKEERKKMERVEQERKQTDMYKGETVLSKSETKEIIEKNIDLETFNHVPNLCPYCGSFNINSVIAEKASDPVERQEFGFIKKHYFICAACQSRWFALEK